MTVALVLVIEALHLPLAHSPPFSDNAPVPTPARVLHNADVRIMDRADSRAQSLAWRDGRLFAVGSRADVTEAAGPDAETWDAGGATVLPGFVDAHHHPSIIALYGGLVRLSPPTITDIASLQRVLDTASRSLPPGQWLVATGWDELLLAERRPPTRRELDDAVPDRPLFALHYSCHRALANSRALELSEIGRYTADPSGGFISRGPDGLPDGLLLERGMSRVEMLARASLKAHDLEGFMARLGEHHRALVAAGITRVVDATVPFDMVELYQEAERRGVLVVPTVMFPVSATGYLETPWDVLDGPATEVRDAVLSTGAMKLVFDGAPVCSMCLDWWQVAGSMVSTWAMALRQGSLDAVRASMSMKPRIGRQVRTGIQIYDRREAREIVKAAADHGFALATHAIGNEAIDVALTAYEAAGSALLRGGVPRIEHATFMGQDLVRRIRDVGAAVVAQPHFMSLPAFSHAPSIPGLRNTPLRWLLDAGVPVAGSSDAPVAGFEPLDGVRSAMSRKTSRGRVHEGDQRIGLFEALTMYTRGAAEVMGHGDLTGTLAAGKRADVVVLDRSIANEAQIEGARVRATVVGGEIAFGKPSA